MAETKKICGICGKEPHPITEYGKRGEWDPILPFYSNKFEEVEPYGTGSYFYHIGCVIQQFKKKLAELNAKISTLKLSSSTAQRGQEVVDRIIEEIDAKGTVSLTQNLILYKTHDNFFLKVTDYQKGYWAQVPISGVGLRGVLGYFQHLAQTEQEEHKEAKQKTLEEV